LRNAKQNQQDERFPAEQSDSANSDSGLKKIFEEIELIRRRVKKPKGVRPKDLIEQGRI
jgi:hypothetical protein